MYNFLKNLFFKPYDVIFFLTFKTALIQGASNEGSNFMLFKVKNKENLLIDFDKWVKNFIVFKEKELNQKIMITNMKIIK